MTPPLRIVFLGTSEVAIPALDRLAARPDFHVVRVVTQPDRPGGRGLKRLASPVKVRAEALGLPVLDPESIRDEAALATLAADAPDLLAVAAYGQFLPGRLLRIPRIASINLHPSLLPRYRGAAPVPWAILHGDDETGVTIQHVSQRMDAGDVILQHREAIRPDDTAVSLLDRLSRIGARLMEEAVDRLRDGSAPRYPQDEAEVVLAPALTREDGRLDWCQSSVALERRIRALVPWPGTYTLLPGDPPDRLKVHSGRVEAGAGRPGEVLESGAGGLLIACGEQALRLTEVQPAGRARMPGGDYARGARLVEGMVLS